MPGGFVGFQAAEIQLGDQLWGRSIALQLRFLNDSAQALTIDSVKSCCGCAIVEVASYEGQILAPGEALPVDVVLSTGHNPGQKKRAVHLDLTSGQRHTAAIHLNVYGTWKVTPEVLDLGELPFEQPPQYVERLVVFESRADELVEVSAPALPWIQCHVAKRAGSRRDILVRILKSELPAGQNSVSVVVRTSNAVKPAGVIFVRARGVHELASVPAPVVIVGAEQRPVEFFDRSGKRARIASLEIEGDGVRGKVLDGGGVVLWREGSQRFPEPVLVRVVDEIKRYREFRVSLFEP